MKKILSKTATAKLVPAEEWEAMHTSLHLYLLYCYFIMQSLFNVYKMWTFTFNMCLPNYCSSNPGVPGLKPMGGSKVNSSFHTSNVN